MLCHKAHKKPHVRKVGFRDVFKSLETFLESLQLSDFNEMYINNININNIHEKHNYNKL